MTFELPVTGTNPKATTKQALESAVNSAISAVAGAAALGYPLKDSVSAGLSSTANGQGFSVRTSEGLSLYVKEGGSANLVSTLATGTQKKAQVDFATTANITLSGVQTIDGASRAAGTTALVKNQSSAAQNGLYTVASGAWTRRADMDTPGEVQGALVYVANGTANGGRSYYTGSAVTTLGSDPIVWQVDSDQSAILSNVAAVQTALQNEVASVQTSVGDFAQSLTPPSRGPVLSGAYPGKNAVIFSDYRDLRIHSYDSAINGAENFRPRVGTLDFSAIQGTEAQVNNRDYGVSIQDDARTWRKRAQRQSVRLSVAGETSNKRTMRIGISADDLARVGIVPGASTEISIAVADILADRVNIASMQINMVWEYHDDDQFSRGIPTVSTYTVRLNDGSTSPLNMASGDAATWTTPTTITQVNDGLEIGWKREGLPLPATYGGKPFKGLTLWMVPTPTTPGAALAYTVSLATVVSGDTLDEAAFIGEPQPVNSNLQSVRIDARNSERILFVGDSKFDNSGYALMMKDEIGRAAELDRTGYAMERYAFSGFQPQDVMYYLENQFEDGTDGNVAFSGAQAEFPIRDYRVTYAVIGLSENTRGDFQDQDLQDVQERFIDYLRAKGVEPILYLSERSWEQAAFFRALGARKGVAVIDSLAQTVRRLGRVTISSLSAGIDVAPQPQNIKWSNSHAGSFESEHSGKLIRDSLSSLLPPPRQSMQLWRRRSSDVVDLDDLLYSDEEQRGAIWRPLNHSQRAMINPHFMHNINSGGSATAIASEGTALAFGRRVNVEDYLLCEFTVPFDAHGIDSLTVNFEAPRAHMADLEVYAYSASRDIAMGSAETTRFVYTGTPTVVIGNTYSFGGTTYTVVAHDARYGAVICTPANASLYTKLTGAAPVASGTLTRTSGAGSATIGFVSAGQGMEAQFYQERNSPVGQWVAMTEDSLGRWSVPISALRSTVDGKRRAKFLVRRTDEEAFSIHNLWLDARGEASQAPDIRGDVFAVPAPTGASLVSQSKFDTSLTGWTTTGSPTGIVPWDAITTEGCTHVALVGSADSLSDTFTYTTSASDDVRAVIHLRARWNPDEWDSAEGDLSTSPVTVESWDRRRAVVRLTNGNFVHEFRPLLGTAFADIYIPVTLHWNLTTGAMSVAAETDDIEVAVLDLRLV